VAFTDVEMAILSKCAYYSYPGENDSKSLYDYLDKNNKNLEDDLGDGYKNAIKALKEKVKDKPYTIVKSVDDKDGTGFAAFAIQDLNNEVTVVCRGTEGFSMDYDSRKDVYADLQLAITLESGQQKSMKQFMKELQQEEDCSGYYFAGHSLGGNLATYGALCLDNSNELKNVVTFNAPGFNSSFLTLYSGEIGRISDRFVHYQNELDCVSECFNMPGKKVILECKGKDYESILNFKAHDLNMIVIDDSEISFQRNRTGIKNKAVWGSVFDTVTTATDTTTPSIILGGVAGEQIGSSIISNSNNTSVRVPVNALQDCARKMQELADENVAIFDRLHNTLQCLEGSGEWTGASARAAIAATENNKKKYSEAINELNELADFVQKFACEISAKDEEIMRKIASV